MKLLTISALFCLFTSCTFKYGKIFKNPDTEGQLGITSSYNEDNIVYTVGKTFTYQVKQLLDSNEIDIKVELLVLEGDFNYQTKIKYKMYYNLDQLTEEQRAKFKDSLNGYTYEITSLDEDSNWIWWHPPRSKTFFDVQWAPWPCLEMADTANNYWSGSLWSGPGWGKYSWKTVHKYYKTTKIEFDEDSNNKTYHIKGAAERKGTRLSTAYFTYHTAKGFTEMKYYFDERNWIEFKLVEG